MKKGSKLYYVFIRKVYFISLAIGVIGLTGKFYLWKYPDFYSETLNVLVIIALVWGAFIYALFQLFQMTEPLKKDYNWELVFPELALEYDEDFNPENLEELKDPRERGKA